MRLLKNHRGTASSSRGHNSTTTRSLGVLEMEFEDEPDIVHREKKSRISPSMLSNIMLLILLVTAAGIVWKKEQRSAQMDFQNEKEHTNLYLHSGGSFGGIYNVAHAGGAKAARDGLALEKIVIPKSNVGHAIPSLNTANLRNHWGHYVHDEFRSPYASMLYDVPKEELDRRQVHFEAKMKEIRETWGAWGFVDPNPLLRGNRPQPNFQVDYKDLPLEDFPPDAWQADEEYVAAFLNEAKSLVHRVKKGILAEYGWSTKSQEDRERFWKVHVCEEENCSVSEGIAVLDKVAFDGLIRKLLHAIMTNDEFYVVLAGHSAAAGHGNDFMQNRIMTFHHLMEPVMDKLGVRLISRNMAMGGVGTLQFTLAGGDLYGETDILEWDSGMTEKGPPVDFFNKQAILSGERVPLLMTDHHFAIRTETNGTAWMGKYVPKNEKNLFPETTFENFSSQPYAARWMNEKNEKYNAVCWEDRYDFTPSAPQIDHPGSQVGWHPGNRQHQWSGRKLAWIVLEGLEAAFSKWEEGIAKEGLPLATSYWHVGDSYKTIRENLRTHINKPQSSDEIRSECEKLIPWLPRICRVQMHGFGMWAPRAHESFDFLNLIHEAPNGYKPDYLDPNAYDGFDLLPMSQAIPDGEVDVHAIAIATNRDPPELDHDWLEDEEDNPNVPTRRELREAAEKVFRRAASTHVEPPKSRKTEAAIVPGRGWEVHGWHPTKAFCDGSAQSECGRHETNNCMMVGSNDKHMDVWGSALSGWLVFTVPKVREGIILLRMEWWCGRKEGTDLTKDWTEVNNGMTNATRRQLRKPTIDQLVPNDFQMDYSVNGEMKTMNKKEWVEYTHEYVKNVAVWPILNDPSMAQRDWEGEAVEVAIRFRSEQRPQQTYCVSHVYYA